ncbi:MAG: RNA polymerase sporulation sigma factor SigK [Eubacteriales bacterium]|nr:RNA polymerase sporulation sigma factor SigK [Eubacteriales bacterium]
MLFSITTALLCGAAFCILRVSSPSGSFPRPLSAEQEAAYIQAMRQGDNTAREKLIEHNLRLVAHIVKKYYSFNADTDDLISIGTIGLIKGVSTFDPGKNARLATYISRCIENEILMYFRASKKLSNEVSLNEPMEQDGDGNSLSYMDILSSNDEQLEQIDLSDRNQLLANALHVLEPREREIITQRYGLDGHTPLTQREVAKLHSISRSYISRIEKKSLQKLRVELDHFL